MQFFQGFLALILPINTPYHILILGAVFASIVGKMLLVALEKYFNPALVGGLFLSGAYPEIVGRVSNYFNLYEIDTIGGVTPLHIFQQIITLHHMKP